MSGSKITDFELIFFFFSVFVTPEYIFIFEMILVKLKKNDPHLIQYWVNYCLYQNFQPKSCTNVGNMWSW